MDLTAVSAQLEKYENKWVAIDESQEKIVGVGDDEKIPPSFLSLNF